MTEVLNASGIHEGKARVNHRHPDLRGHPNRPMSFDFDRIDATISAIMRRHGVRALRISLGIIFIWFGILKPLGLSPAAELVRNTVYWISPDWFVPLLGWWEVAIGVFLLFRSTIRIALFLLFLQMPGTFFPLILLP